MNWKRRRNDEEWIMLIKDIGTCEYFKAVDNTTLCELLHPAKEDKDLEIRYSIAHAIVKPGETTLPYRLKTSAEVYYLLEGEGIKAIYIHPNSKQYVQNTGNSDLSFLRIAYPMWRMEDEEVL
jgi:mannose-6-phosphate isomerase-like protein (cupin superfamily)